MKKFILSTIVILGFTVYSLNQKGGGIVNNTPVVINNPVVETINTTPTAVAKSKPKVVAPIFRGDDQNEYDDEDSYRSISQPAVTQVPTVTPVSIPKPVTTPAPMMNPPVGMMNTGKYKNGTYTGSSEYAYSDYVQVSAVISGGRLTDVQFPSTTGGPGRSQQIYSNAMPQLKSEAISAQNANVNTISGATYTSAAFAQSLATALSQALN